MTILKKTILAASAAMMLAGSALAAELSTATEKQSYALGASVGHYISNQVYNQTELGVDVNMDLLVEGFVAALKNTSMLSEEQVVDLLNERLVVLNEKRDAVVAKTIQANKEAGEAYLIDNKLKDGVVVTESGLQYQVMTMGNGVKPKAEDVVTVNFVGKLLDGTEFESTYTQNAPARMAVMTLIPGWAEGLQLMPEGSTFRFTLPAALAYGAEGAGAIPPESVLIFDIELAKVEAQKDKVPTMGSMGGMGGMSGH
ncbi:MAG: FKBP-type peptidyl-prolyl cis-trans isomerase [Shewanella sp.]